MELDKQVVPSAHFQHVVFDNRRASAQQPTWVFIDGDGNAWLRDGLASEDPTPVDPLALRLMLQVSGRAVYLARPCAFDLARSDPRCSAQVWTVDRYSEEVVESMRSALVTYFADDQIVLAGFSGGAVLATQLADRLDSVVGLVTIAGNLDVARWAEHHGYSAALAARSAPLRLPPKRQFVRLHVFGAEDDNAPFELSAELLAGDPGARVRVFATADHDCCWAELWPRISAEFQQLMEAASLTWVSSAVR
ncbi:MAG: alpha/beta hydrolase [Gammaproteobacteria bacterium]|nr:alpha/beta hydrolase [Gammaproteobacteria bacterium]